MSKDVAFRSAALAVLTSAGFLSFVGCEPKGPAERAGASIDRGVQNARDAVNPPGPIEKAGRGVDKVLNR